ncbi:MAG: hypothetical protein LBU83_13195 [Bacteroidales bacterium]|nr:hypothetical protein [Bacteroidales bacterium]
MRSMLDPPPPTPGVALERALAEDRTALTSGRFSQEAMSIAGRRLNKYGREARAWVNEETSRFEALLNIRDTEGREEIESMMNEAEAAFNEAHDRTNFVTDPSGRRRPASEQDRNNAREVAANAVIDNFIRSKMPDE